MPIFVSRFSPERSLIGNFLSSRTPAREVQERAETDLRVAPTANGGNSAQRGDRVRPAENRSAPDAARSTPDNTASEQDATSQNITPDSLTLLDQLRLRRNAANLVAEIRESVGSAEPIQDPPAESETAGGGAGPLAERLTALVEELASDGPGGVVAPTEASPDLIETASAENQQANEAAATERLEVLIDALQTSDTAAVGAAAVPPATPTVIQPREEQERTLRQDVQTIATGLRQDAAIEGQRSAEQTARTSNAAADRGQRQEVRDNQREIQSLQTDRRSSQQDVQRADQAIRQLQTRNNRIQSSAPQPNAGNSLDLLAE